MSCTSCFQSPADSEKTHNVPPTHIDFQARPWSPLDPADASHEDSSAVRPPLRSKASSTSIASDTSTSSDTTFLSTASFSTTTGAHFRSQTQEELSRNGRVDAGTDDDVPGDDQDFNYEQDEDGTNFDLDALEVAILTPRETMRIFTPLDRLSLTQPPQPQRASHQEEPSLPRNGGEDDEGEEQGSPLRPLSFSPTSRRHTKSSSHHSTDGDTIKGRHSIDASLSSLSKDISFKSRRLRSDRQQHSQDSKLVQENEQELDRRVESWRGGHRGVSGVVDDGTGERDNQITDMQLASPDYRKSMAPSVQSDVAADHLYSPTKGRGSSVYMTAETPYTNLLRDATLIIEQQQQRQPGPSPWIGGDHDSDESSATTYSTDPKSQTLGSSRCGPVDMTPLDTIGSGTTERILTSSNKSIPTRSRSRRFSAPGNQFSSQSSLSSLSQFTRTGAAGGSKKSGDQQQRGGDIHRTVARAPQALSGYQAKSPRDPSVGGDSDSDDWGGGGQEKKAVGSSKHATNLHPLQHHPTMQAAVTTSSTTSTTDELLQPSLHLNNNNFNNQIQQRHDYRQGVVFEYYEGEWDWLPNFDEMRPLHAGIVGNFMIDDTTERDLFRPQGQEFMAASRPGNNNNNSNNRSRPAKESGNFAVRFTTHIDITQDGVYSFWLSSNDGSVLYIANNLVVENDGMHYAAEVEGRVLLQAGKHAMTVEFFHRNGKMLEGFRSTGPSLVVSYRKPGPVWSFGLTAGPKRVIKSSNLFYDHGGMSVSET